MTHATSHRPLVRHAGLVALLALAGFLGAPALAQTPRAVVGAVAEPAQVRVGQATKVRFSADIGDPTLIAGGVNLLRVGAAGTNPAVVGVMRDDGTGGDEIAGDGRYSLEVTLNEPVQGPVAFRVSAAFRGTLLRTVTPDIVVTALRNRPPVAIAGTDQSVRVGTRVTVDGRRSYDLDADLLSFRWTLVKPVGSAAALDDPTLVKPAFTPDVAGAYHVQLIVNDGQVDSLVSDTTVLANATNAPPTAVIGGVLSRPFGAGPTLPVALTAAASFDPEHAPLGYTWKLMATPASSTAAVLAGTTTATPVLTADKPGRYVVSLKVNDGVSDSATVTTTIILYAPNTAPQANAGADLTVATGSTVALSGAASDADADPIADVRWSFVERPAGSVATLTAPATLAPSFVADVPGDYLLELAVTDARGALGKSRVVVRASGPADSDHDGVPNGTDQCPNTAAGAKVDSHGCSAAQLPALKISLLTAAPSTGMAPLSVAFKSQAAGGAGGYVYAWTFGDAGTAAAQNVTHVYQLPKTYTATVTATDALGTTAQASATIIATAPVGNKAPTVNAGSNQAITMPGTASLAATVTDDGLPAPPGAVTTNWSVVSGPGAVTFGAASARITTASFTLPGMYVLRLTADDGALKTSGDVTITVADAGPSLAALADRTIPLGTHYTLRLAANDPNPLDTASFTLVGGPAGATLTAAGLLDWTPTAAQLGPNTLTVKATDGFGHSAQRAFVITVVNANRAPVLGALADANVPQGSIFSRTLSATDPDAGEVLTYALVSGPSLMFVSGADLRWPTAGVPVGSYPVVVKVTDKGGLVDVKRFVLNVTPAALPVANDDSYSVTLGKTLAISAPGVLGNDVDPLGGILSAVKLGNPAKGTLTAFGGDGSFTYQAPPTLQLPVFKPVLKVNSQPYFYFGTNPVVADLDGDGKAEFVTRGFNGVLALRSDGSALWTRTSFAAPYADCFMAYGGTSFGVAVGDVDDDGKPEVVTSVRCNRDEQPPYANGNVGAGPQSRMIALNGLDGTVKWLSPPLSALTIPSGPNFAQVELASGATPTIARLRAGQSPSVLIEVAASGAGGGAGTVGIDPNGNPVYGPACMHIVAVVPDGTYHYPDPTSPGHYYQCRGVLALDGATGIVRQRMIAPGRDDGGYQQTGRPGPIVVDLDGDGVPEIVAGTVVYNNDGTIRWQDPNATTAETAVGNFDDTPDVEIVRFESSRGTEGAALSVMKADGTVLWRMPFDGPTVVSKLTVADIDGSGRPSILVNLWTNLCAFDYQGNYRWCYDATRNGIPKISSGSRHAVYDLDGDGVPEVIVSTMEQLLFLDGSNGTLKYAFDTTTIPNLVYPPSTQNNSYETPAPVVADVDGNGHADVVFTWVGNDYGAPGRMTILKAQNDDWQPARRIMNQEAYFGANVNDDGTIPQLPLGNPFATDAGNVFGSQPRITAAVDPRKREQASFPYAAVAGGLQSTPATVTIDLLPVNRPPVFVSTPPRRYIRFAAFSYAAHATDPDVGDTVTYKLESYTYNGGNCAMDAVTGLLTCNQIQSDERAMFLISATDSQGARTLQTLLLQPSTGSSTVPNVVGQTQAAAQAALTAAGFAVGTVTQAFGGAAAGQVLSQAPQAGVSLLNGETIALSVSKGPQPVPVPFVVGQAATSAQTLLASSGFAVTITRVFSDVIPADVVMTQTPPAGTSFSPSPSNPVALTVSAGNGLSLKLDRSITTGGSPIVATVLATDANGAPVAVPAMTFAITPHPAEFLGPLPTFAGGTITTAATTMGAFVLTATDPATGRVVRRPFVVTAPGGGTGNGDSFARMSQALESIYALRPALVAARKANDVPQMQALLRQIVTLWRTVDPDDLKFAQPISPPDGFPPTLAQLAQLGQSATVDDVLSQSVIDDANAALKAWTDGLNTPNVSMAELNALADQFGAKAAALGAIDVSEYGGIANAGRYQVAVGHRVPAFFEALTRELAELTGMPGRTAPFPNLKSATRSRSGLALKNTLGEQLTVIAVDYVVDKVMAAGIQTYGNARDYAVSILTQGAWTAVVVGVRSHLQAWLQGQDIIEVVAGSSLSFREFQSAPSFIEVNGSRDADANVVMLLGPDLLAASKGAAEAFVAKLKEGYSANLDPKTNPNRYKNLNQIKKDLTAFKDLVKQALADAQVVVDAQAKLVFQSPDYVLNGCVFASTADCVQLVYDSGLKPVYTFSPPPGFGGFSGLPVPILFMVYNAATGQLYFGTPSFMPCGIETKAGNTLVTCPNNPPFAP